MTRGLLVLAMVVAAGCCRSSARADSTLVFNEIMYHPQGEEALWEWVELHNQMAVDMDISGWSIQSGIDYIFPAGTIVPGRGYLVLAGSPPALAAATGLAQILGPFEKRLANSGERLELRNHNQRLMDTVRYRDDDEWPVGPDGGGVSLAKRHPDLGSRDPRNWTMSAEMGGTPGHPNFPAADAAAARSTPVSLTQNWRFNSSGADLGTRWQESDYDDSEWAVGSALFFSGATPIDAGDYETLPTLFSTGIRPDGTPAVAGGPDPHYVLTQSAYSAPPPPEIPATVISHHPAWAPNDTLSGWIGPAHPGTTEVPHGNYFYRTRFDLDGFIPETVQVRLRIAVDNDLNDIRLNGQTQGIQFSGFAGFSSEHLLTTGFGPGANTLDFHTYNGGTTPNPAGFRVRLTGTGFRPVPARTPIAPEPAAHFFRAPFVFAADPAVAELELSAVVADGAVFYLNGVEIHRLNTPPGPVTTDTRAETAVERATRTGPVAISATALRRGTNVLSAQVHRAEAGHSGIVFGAELTFRINPALRPRIAFNEVGGSRDADFQIELVNDGARSVALDGFELGGSGSAAEGYVFPAGHTIEVGGFLVLTEAQLGFRPNPGNKLFLYTPGQGALLDAVTVRDRSRGRFPEATGRWLYPSEPTFGSANVFAFRDEVVINEIMYHPQPVLEQAAAYDDRLLLPVDGLWKYWQGGDPGPDWPLVDYGDQAWPVGAALLYVEESTLPAPKNTPLTLGQISYYFRTDFVFGGDTNGLQLRLRPILDDGAVFYLNGAEVFRFNMPDGPVGHSTQAASAIDNATFTGPYDLPADRLIVGTNVLAVSVHQHSIHSSDIVFGMELWARARTAPGSEYRERDDYTWIELYNRAADPVDLTGWTIEGGIDFDFLTGTIIPPDGYLVVAQDPALMSELHPGIPVVGGFRRRLSNRSDLIALIDPQGNPANEVEYYDGGRWPAAADGDGSSLELRDPWADNSKPEAWAASDESEQSEWRQYAYRMVALQAVGPSLWQELVIGLLHTGEVLLDDISVVESPGGSAGQLIQNGAFEHDAVAWRFLGNHRHSRIIVDPDNPANRVLHLVATGPTEHMHNHLETTLSSGARVVDGREYEISFRAKWLSGSRRLNTRLYFNRAAQTTVLAAPLLNGTPGRRNSRYAGNIGPTFTGFRHTPPVPDPGQAAGVSVVARDPDGVDSCVLWWSADAGPWNSIAMQEQSEGLYHAPIPGQPAATAVQFYVEATDTAGARSTFPARGRDSRALYQVHDGFAAPGWLQNVRIVMTPADVNWVLAATNLMSNDHLGATVIYNEEQVFYDLGIRLQASQRGRPSDARVGFTVRFHPDRLFRGVHDSITLDRSGGYSGRGGRQDEIVLKHIMNHAGGLAGMVDDLAYVIAPRLQHTGPSLLMMAKYGDIFLDSQFANGKDGDLFKMELIYYPTTSVNNDPQMPKLPQPDQVVGTDFRNLGEDREDYRWNFLISNKRRRDDYAPLIRLAQAFELSGAAIDRASRELLDVDQWLRAFALKSLSGDVDTYGHGLEHNFMVYFPPEDKRARAFLWDQDFAWARSVTAPIVPGGNVAKIVNLPHNLRLYYGHLFDLIHTSYNTATMARWTAHYGSLVGQDYSGVLTYIGQRANHVLGQLPARVPFEIATHNGQDFMVDTPDALIRGAAWIDIKHLSLAGHPWALEWTWPTPTTWNVTVPLVLGANPLSFVSHDFRGNPVATQQITVVSTARTGGIDTDGDGMPDLWELAHGLDPHWAGDADLDYNGNGLTNLEEYWVGTNPREQHPGLLIAVTLDRDGAVRLKWTAVAGRAYTVQRQAGLGQQWENAFRLPPQLATQTVEWVDDVAEPSPRWYRLVTP